MVTRTSSTGRRSCEESSRVGLRSHERKGRATLASPRATDLECPAMQLHPGPRTGACARRAGFSLVEILVVITIIGVLIALLVVALGGANTTVQQAAVTAEIEGFSQGLRKLTTDYNVDFPPDFSANPPGVTNRQVIDRFVSRIFRNRNPQTDVPRQAGGGMQPLLLENLDPSEALWFWMRGFSNDPQNPLFGPLNITDPAQVERTALMDMQKAQLRDEDQDGFMEYYPKSGSQMPLVYYVNSNYVRAFVSPESNMRALRFSSINAAAALIPPRPYLSTTTVTLPNPWIRQHFAAPDTFQILACGLDGEFGTPIDNSSIPAQPAPGAASAGTPGPHVAFAYPTGPYPEKAHLDNITNFAGGTLESDLP